MLYCIDEPGTAQNKQNIFSMQMKAPFQPCLRLNLKKKQFQKTNKNALVEVKWCDRKLLFEVIILMFLWW